MTEWSETFAFGSTDVSAVRTSPKNFFDCLPISSCLPIPQLSNNSVPYFSDKQDIRVLKPF